MKAQFGDYERWEIAQLKRSGVLAAEDHPDLDDERGVLGFEETEEQLDVELNDATPGFMQGHSRLALQTSSSSSASSSASSSSSEPVKVIRMPEGSLHRASLEQAQLAKGRRLTKTWPPRAVYVPRPRRKDTLVPC